jgi:predicted metal-dependent peptidase
MSNALRLVENEQRPDLRALFEVDPGICGLALFLTIHVRPNAETTIASDGKRLYVNDKFATLPERERVYTLAHGVMHHALRHAPRMKRMRALDFSFNPIVWNVAADLVVNAALEQIPSMTAPKKSLSIESLLPLIPDAQMLSVEQLYRKLLTLLERAEVAQMVETVERDLLFPMGDTGDEGDDPSEEDHQDTALWGERLRRGFGRYPAGLSRILAHLPKTKTPWHTILRSFIVSAIGEQYEIDYARPHRRWLATEYERSLAGFPLPVTPGQRIKPKPRIAVAIDTSGSIGDKILARFISEISAIMTQMGAAVRVITCDADVHQIKDFTNAADLRRFVPRGGGGTSFDPAFDAAISYKPNVMVYLTDLEAEHPAKPPFPVIWAIPTGTTIVPKFGRLVELE